MFSGISPASSAAKRHRWCQAWMGVRTLQATLAVKEAAATGHTIMLSEWTVRPRPGHLPRRGQGMPLLSLAHFTVVEADPITLIEAAQAGGYDAIGLRIVPPFPTDHVFPVIGDRNVIRS